MYRLKIHIVIFIALSSCSQPKEEENTVNNQAAETEFERKKETITKGKSQESNSWQEPIVKKLSVTGYFPQFANDQTIIYSSSNYEGLWVYSLTDNTVTQISDKAGAGYDPVCRGDTVIFQVKSPVKRLEMALISTRKVIEQIDTRVSPQRYFVQYFEDAKPYAMVVPDMLSIEIVLNDKRYEVAPNGKKNYLNASLSPNGEKLLYEVAGGEVHIADLLGNIETSIEKADAPKWVDNKQLLYTLRTEEDMQIVSSQIYILDIAQDTTFSLTDLKMIENPSSNPPGDQIVANTPDGEIYLIHKK